MNFDKLDIRIEKHEHGHAPMRIEIHGGKGIPIEEFEMLKQQILENNRIANELKDMYERSKVFIQENPDAWDSDLIEHFIQKAEFILKNMIASTTNSQALQEKGN